MSKLITYILNNNLEITEEDINFINNRITLQKVKREEEINKEKYKDCEIVIRTLKDWSDYNSDEYHFHSPPDCMYFENESIHAETIESMGGKNYEFYKLDNKYIEISSKEEFREWNFKTK
jgi:hypothetical protein